MATVTPTELERAKQAIAGIESSGNYGAIGPSTKYGRAYGKYQVLETNIPSWTKQALGKTLTPQQFLSDPTAQERVFETIFSGYVSKYGDYGSAAKVWFGGPGALKNADAKDVLGTSVQQYADRFSSLFGGNAPAQRNALSGELPSMSGLSGGNLVDFSRSLDEAVNLARQNRNKASLDLMGPYRGTVAASDFNGILSGLDQASNTFVEDTIRRPLAKLAEQNEELLSVTEAQALGLPYGTTKQQAATRNITPKDASTDALTAGQKTKTDSINAVIAQMQNYRSLYDSYVGFTGAQLTGSEAAELRTAKSALEFAIAAAVGTGALQAADRAVVQDLLPDPTSLRGASGIAARGGKAGSLASIDQAISIFQSTLGAVNSPNPSTHAPASFTGKTSSGLQYTVTQ